MGEKSEEKIPEEQVIGIPNSSEGSGESEQKTDNDSGSRGSIQNGSNSNLSITPATTTTTTTTANNPRKVMEEATKSEDDSESSNEGEPSDDINEETAGIMAERTGASGGNGEEAGEDAAANNAPFDTLNSMKAMLNPNAAVTQNQTTLQKIQNLRQGKLYASVLVAKEVAGKTNDIQNPFTASVVKRYLKKADKYGGDLIGIGAGAVLIAKSWVNEKNQPIHAKNLSITSAVFNAVSMAINIVSVCKRIAAFRKQLTKAEKVVNVVGILGDIAGAVSELLFMIDTINSIKGRGNSKLSPYASLCGAGAALAKTSEQAYQALNAYKERNAVSANLNGSKQGEVGRIIRNYGAQNNIINPGLNNLNNWTDKDYKAAAVVLLGDRNIHLNDNERKELLIFVGGYLKYQKLSRDFKFRLGGVALGLGSLLTNLGSSYKGFTQKDESSGKDTQASEQDTQASEQDTQTTKPDMASSVLDTVLGGGTIVEGGVNLAEKVYSNYAKTNSDVEHLWQEVKRLTSNQYGLREIENGLNGPNVNNFTQRAADTVNQYDRLSQLFDAFSVPVDSLIQSRTEEEYKKRLLEGVA